MKQSEMTIECYVKTRIMKYIITIVWICACVEEKSCLFPSHAVRTVLHYCYYNNTTETHLRSVYTGMNLS